MCTGAAKRSFGALFWVLVVVMMALSLQGCDYDIPVHNVGNWRGQTDYLIKHEFITPGGSARNANLNSCSLPHLSQTLQCSGRGVCKQWAPTSIDNQLSFCECDRDWADPECRTRRKSQAVAYLLSVFFGFLGADQFYLGFASAGFLKLFSLGGFGILWVIDVVKIGSAPVYSNHYRLAADLPHYFFVLITTFVAITLGFVIAYVVTINFRNQKRRQALLMQLDEDNRQKEAMKPYAAAYGTQSGAQQPTMPYGSMGMPGMNPFGAASMKMP